MTEDLILKYRNAAIAHGEGTQAGDYHVTNRAYDTLTEVLKELSAAGNDIELLSLFDDEYVSVQVWSAALQVPHFLCLDGSARPTFELSSGCGLAL